MTDLSQSGIDVRVTIETSQLPKIVLEKKCLTPDQVEVLFDGFRDAVKAASILGPASTDAGRD